MTVRAKILNEIEKERDYQNSVWGESFDKNNTLNDWLVYINNYASRAGQMGATPKQIRSGLLKVATLAVAALERFDDGRGFAPRHYDEVTPETAAATLTA